MKKDMYESHTAAAWNDDLAIDLDRECELWDWARAAGVSALDLRIAVRDSMSLSEES